MFVGFQRTDRASPFGGRFLVETIEEFGLPVPATGHVAQVTIPCLADWCGLRMVFQVVEYDPGAALGVSFTPGLEMTMGN